MVGGWFAGGGVGETARLMRRLRGFLRHHRATMAFLLLVAGNVAGWASLQAEQDARHNQVEEDEARRCVSEWETQAQLRDAIEEGARIPADALAEVTRDVDDPDLAELVREYQALVDVGVRSARDELGDPDCDLPAAQDHLGT